MPYIVEVIILIQDTSKSTSFCLNLLEQYFKHHQMISTGFPGRILMGMNFFPNQVYLLSLEMHNAH